jgi:cell shape-determining protein MreC
MPNYKELKQTKIIESYTTEEYNLLKEKSELFDKLQSMNTQLKEENEKLKDLLNKTTEDRNKLYDYVFLK